MAFPRTRKSFISFNGGLLSPKMDARNDTEKFQTGCRQLQNFLPWAQGGVTRRRGFEYQATAKYSDSARPVRVLQFQFSQTDGMIIEMGDYYMRFYSRAGQVLDSSTGDPYEISSPYSASECFAVQTSQINDVIFMAHPLHAPQKLTRLAIDDWTLEQAVFDAPVLLDENVTATTITASATTGTGITLTASDAVFVPQHVGSTWQIAILRDQTNIQIDLTSTQTIALGKILGNWTFNTYGTWAGTVEIQSQNIAGIWETVRTYQSNQDANFADVGSQNNTAVEYQLVFTYSSSTGSPAPRAVFAVADGLVYGTVNITGYTDSTHVTADVVDDLYSTDPTIYWSEAAWSDYRGYPTCVCFFQQRLWFAGSSYEPQTFWGSVTGDYQNFTLGSLASSSVTFELSSSQRSQILWMVPQKKLVIGTSGGVYAAYGDELEAAITATAPPLILLQSQFPMDYQRAVMVNSAILAVQSSGLKVREMVFDGSQGIYTANDLTVMADQIGAGGIITPAYQQDRDSIFWAVTGVGNLISMIYEKEQNVVAWANHTTQGVFESVDTIKGTIDDEVWVSVLRTIGGTQYRFIERMTGYYNPSIDYFPPSVASDGAWTPFNLDNLVGGNASSYAGARNPYWPAPWDHGQLNNLGFATGQIFTGQSASANGIPSGIPSSPLSLDLSSLYSQYETASFPITAAPGNNTGWPSGSISAPFYAAGVHPDLGFWYGSICGIFRDASGNTMPLRSFGIYIAADSDGTSVTVNFLNNAGKIVNTQSSAIPISTAQFFGCYSLDESVVGFQVMSNGGKFALVNSVGPGLAGHFDPNIPVQYPGDQSTETFVDSCIIATPSSPSVTVTGLDHLNGASVVALADSKPVGPFTVVDGSITLPVAASIVQVGLPYESVLQPMRLDTDTQVGGTAGLVKRIHKLVFRVMDTASPIFVGSTATKTPISYPLPLAATTAPYLFNGDREIDHVCDYDWDATFVVRQSLPIPLTLLGVVVKYQITES